MTAEPAEEPVPKLPRGRGLRLSGPQIVRIAFTLFTLIGVILLTRPCANAVSNFVTGMDGSGSAMPKPGTVDVPAPQPQYEQLTPGMTEEQLKAAVERAKARASGSGSAGP